MQKTVYENYKYSLQDTAKVYIGAKYTFAELLDQDEVAFKFRLIVERYILAEKEVDPQDTLETHLYYLKPDSFLVKIYDRIKARVKINIIEEKKRIFGRGKKASCPLYRLLIEPKAQWLNQVQPGAGRHTGSPDITGIGRNLRLK